MTSTEIVLLISFVVAVLIYTGVILPLCVKLKLDYDEMKNNAEYLKVKLDEAIRDKNNYRSDLHEEILKNMTLRGELNELKDKLNKEVSDG